MQFLLFLVCLLVIAADVPKMLFKLDYSYYVQKQFKVKPVSFSPESFPLKDVIIFIASVMEQLFCKSCTEYKHSGSKLEVSIKMSPANNFTLYLNFIELVIYSSERLVTCRDIVSDDDKYTVSKLGHLFISNFSDR